MSQDRLWPPPPPPLPPPPAPSRFLLHHHLLLSVSPPMGEQQPLITTATTTTTTNPSPSSSSSQDPTLPNPSPSSSTTTTTATAGPTKLPFRPRKIRKISAADADPSKSQASNPSKQLAFRVVPRPLSAEGELDAALRHLRSADPLLAAVIDAHDPPTFQSLHPPFHSLARSILYQQLAFKAAASIYARFISLLGGEAGVVPDAVLALTPHQLRQIGVSGRKASYLHDLARKYATGILSDAAVAAMDDKSLFAMLTMVKGIGAWSVHMFMIFSLHRPDVLPAGDLGVRKGVQILYGLDEVPRPSQMDGLCERWRPYRSVGAWYMWRLVEAKGSPTMASVGGAASSTAAHQQQQQQPQFVDPIQMLPSLG